MADIEQKPILNIWAEDTSDYNEPSETEIAGADGINPNESIDAEPVNGFARILFLATQFLQRTGGLYGDTIPYIAGQSVSVMRLIDSEYRISKFTCISDTEITGTPPLTGATVATTNGVDVYTGGTIDTENWVLDFPIVGDNWQDTLESDLLDNMASALVNLIGLGSNSFTAVSTDVYTTLIYTNATALFSTTASNTPDSSVGWIIQATVVNGTSRQFLAFNSSYGIRFGHSTDGTVTWENVFSGLSVGTNWETALAATLATNSASLLSTGINSDWLTVVTAAIANSITNSMLAQMAANTIKGVTTAGDPTDLTATEVTAMLDAATSSLQGMMSAADKATLDLYPDTLGTNWATALAATLASNMQNALTSNLGFGSTSFSALTTSVYSTLLHSGDVSIFSSSATGVPNSNYSWIIQSILINNTTKIFIACNTLNGFYLGHGTSETNIVWTTILLTGTYEINSDETFQTLCDSTSGSYPRVFVKSGTWSSTSALDLSTTGITEIIGEDGAILDFSIASESYAITGTGEEEINNVEFTLDSTDNTSCSIIYNVRKIDKCTFTLDSTDSLVTGLNNCSYVENVIMNIPAGSATYNIYACSNCTNIVGVQINSSAAILAASLYLFYNCTNISNVDINLSAGFATLYCFYNSTNAKNINATLVSTSSSVAYLGNTTCSDISGVNCTFTGSGIFYAFDDVDNISNVTLDITSSNTTTGIYLFNDCNNLSNIKIASALSYASYYWFYGCYNISDIYFNVTTTSGGIFYGIYGSYNVNGVYCISTGAGRIGALIQACYNVSNIHAAITTTDSSTQYVLRTCQRFSDVKIILTAESGTIIAIHSCYNGSNISETLNGVGNSTYLIYGMSACERINNFDINVNITEELSPDAYGVGSCYHLGFGNVEMPDSSLPGFHLCYGMSQNYVGTGTIDGCYVDYTGTTAITANGPNFGWNYAASYT